MKTQNIKQISFKRYLGPDIYGTQADRDVMKYKIGLTPQKIDTVIKNAKTTDDGMVEAYKLLMKENEHVNKAFRGMDVITKHYLFVYKDRVNEIKKVRPKGAKIPWVGIVPEYIAKVTDGFINRIGGYCNDLIEDFNAVVNQNFHKGLNTIVTDYVKNEKHLREGIEYVNEVKGDSPVRNYVKESLKKQSGNLKDSYGKLELQLNNLAKTLEGMSTQIIKGHKRGQNIRLSIKAVIKIIGAGSV